MWLLDNTIISRQALKYWLINQHSNVHLNGIIIKIYIVFIFLSVCSDLPGKTCCSKPISSSTADRLTQVQCISISAYNIISISDSIGKMESRKTSIRNYGMDLKCLKHHVIGVGWTLPLMHVMFCSSVSSLPGLQHLRCVRQCTSSMWMDAWICMSMLDLWDNHICEPYLTEYRWTFLQDDPLPHIGQSAPMVRWGLCLACLVVQLQASYKNC